MAKQRVYEGENGFQMLTADYTREGDKGMRAEGCRFIGADCTNYICLSVRNGGTMMHLFVASKTAREFAKQLNRAARFAETGK